MFLYHLRLAWKSLRRTPILSLLTVAAIALGIAVATSFVTIHYLLAGDPLPGKSDRLYYVRLDSWDPERPFNPDFPERPPNQVTYRDAMALLQSDIPVAKVVMFRANLFVHPEGTGVRPFTASTRVTNQDFFSLFEVPFRYGGPWPASADREDDAQVVLSAALNEKLFGGQDSVGKRFRIDQRLFTVAGVLAPWRPALKFYDVNNGSENPPEELFVPISVARPLLIVNTGNTSNWAAYEGVAGKYDSEAVWLQAWVQLDTPAQKAAYQTFLDAYVGEQRKAGRFQRPTTNWIQPMREWHAEEEAVPSSARSMMVIALLFLVVCSVNLIGLLLGKFLARAPEVGVRRALGASRREIFLQHLVECELTAIVGGGLGVLASWGLLGLITRWLEGDSAYHLNLPMAGVGVLLTLAAGLLAGVYPAWRVCAVAPAIHLKLQ